MYYKSKLFRASLLGGIAGLFFAGQCDRKHQQPFLETEKQEESELQESIPKGSQHATADVLEQSHLHKLGKLTDFDPSYDKEKSIQEQYDAIYTALESHLYKLFEENEERYFTKKALKNVFKNNLTGELKSVVQQAIEGAKPWSYTKRWKSARENTIIVQFILQAITACHLIDQKLSHEEQVNTEVVQLGIGQLIPTGCYADYYFILDDKKRSIGSVTYKKIHTYYPAQLVDARKKMTKALGGQHLPEILTVPTKNLEQKRQDALTTLGRWKDLKLITIRQGYYKRISGIRTQVEKHIYDLLDQQKPRGIYKASLENIFKGQLTGELRKAVKEALTVAVPYYKIEKFRSSSLENGPITSFIVEAITACHWVEQRVQEGKLNKEDIDQLTRNVDINRTWKCFDVYKMSKNRSTLDYSQEVIIWPFNRKYKNALERAVSIMQNALRASLPRVR